MARAPFTSEFTSTLERYPGKGGWTFAPVPKRHAPPVTRPWGRAPVRATVDGVEWDTSVWRDSKNDRSLLAVPKHARGGKGHGDRVRVKLILLTDADGD
jgi:hypothetical protein